jgi:hypothetical protein
MSPNAALNSWSEIEVSKRETYSERSAGLHNRAYHRVPREVDQHPRPELDDAPGRTKSHWRSRCSSDGGLREAFTSAFPYGTNSCRHFLIQVQKDLIEHVLVRDLSGSGAQLLKGGVEVKREHVAGDAQVECLAGLAAWRRGRSGGAGGGAGSSQRMRPQSGSGARRGHCIWPVVVRPRGRGVVGICAEAVVTD